MENRKTALPAWPLRSGALIPDWSAVTTDRNRQVLLTWLMLYGPEKAWSNLGPEEDRVRKFLLRSFLDTGKAPGRDEIGRRLGLGAADVDSSITSLRRRDLVVLDSDGVVVGAYPFTSNIAEHRVLVAGHEINAMCAIDALGVGAMARSDALIMSRCRECQTSIRVATSDRGSRIREAQPAETKVWIGLHYRDNCAANSLCTTMCFFCSDAHLEAWCATRTHLQEFRLSVAEALEQGRAVFEPLLPEFGTPPEEPRRTIRS